MGWNQAGGDTCRGLATPPATPTQLLVCRRARGETGPGGGDRGRARTSGGSGGFMVTSCNGIQIISYITPI